MTPLDVLDTLMENNTAIWYEAKDGRELWISDSVSAEVATAIRANKEELVRLLTRTSEMRAVIYHRLARGLHILWTMERANGTETDDYKRLYGVWEKLLSRYGDGATLPL